MNLNLAGKIALVTGSSSGIGEAITKELASEGASVVIHGRDKAKTHAVTEQINTEKKSMLGQ